MSNETRRTRIRWQLLAIVFVCMLPVALSCFFYFVLKPQGGMSYGHLLQTRSLAHTGFKTDTGQGIELSLYRGKWLLLMIAGGQCDQNCREQLFAMRQYRIGQGSEAERITRIWVVDDAAAVASHLPPLLIEGVEIIRSTQFDLATQALSHQSIFLLDPLGNQVMRYQQGQDHRKIMHEIGKILQNNQGLG